MLHVLPILVFLGVSRCSAEEENQRQLTKIPRHVICRGRRQPASQPGSQLVIQPPSQQGRIDSGGALAIRGRLQSGRPAAQHSQATVSPSVGLLRRGGGQAEADGRRTQEPAGGGGGGGGERIGANFHLRLNTQRTPRRAARRALTGRGGANSSFEEGGREGAHSSLF